MLAELMFGRSYNCIHEIERQFSYEMLVCGTINTRLPFRLRASFARLLNHCYIDRFPQVRSLARSFARHD